MRDSQYVSVSLCVRKSVNWTINIWWSFLVCVFENFAKLCLFSFFFSVHLGNRSSKYKHVEHVRVSLYTRDYIKARKWNENIEDFFFVFRFALKHSDADGSGCGSWDISWWDDLAWVIVGLGHHCLEAQHMEYSIPISHDEIKQTRTLTTLTVHINRHEGACLATRCDCVALDCLINGRTSSIKMYLTHTLPHCHTNNRTIVPNAYKWISMLAYDKSTLKHSTGTPFVFQ